MNDLPEKAGPVRLGEDLTMTDTTDARARRSAGRIGAVPKSADGPMLATDREGELIARRVPSRQPERGAFASRHGLSPLLRAHARYEIMHSWPSVSRRSFAPAPVAGR